MNSVQYEQSTICCQQNMTVLFEQTYELLIEFTKWEKLNKGAYIEHKSEKSRGTVKLIDIRISHKLPGNEILKQ